jgi:hypothetical protein
MLSAWGSDANSLHTTVTNTLAYCSNQFSPGCITSNVHKRTIREGALEKVLLEKVLLEKVLL